MLFANAYSQRIFCCEICTGVHENIYYSWCTCTKSFMHENFIFMYEKVNFVDENEFFMQENKNFMHENEFFAQNISLVKIPCMNISGAKILCQG